MNRILLTTVATLVLLAPSTMLWGHDEILGLPAPNPTAGAKDGGAKKAPDHKH